MKNIPVPTVDPKTLAMLLKDQQDEITAHHLYKRIAVIIKDPHNAAIINCVADDELKHYNRLKTITGKDAKPQWSRIFTFTWIIRLLGITFGMKLLEKYESKSIESYGALTEQLAFMDEMVEDEDRHEKELIALIDEERLNYMGSVVLGLNDALVELTGALAGYTFAFQNTKLIALTGLITGISAAFSMAASEYLSTRQEGGDDALKSALYTGMAYIFTVVMLITPFLIIGNPFISLVTTLEMAAISMGVAGISFLIGVVVKMFIGIEI